MIACSTQIAQKLLKDRTLPVIFSEIFTENTVDVLEHHYKYGKNFHNTHMKKLLFAFAAVVITGCASIEYQEGCPNYVEIRKVLLLDSTSAYIIDWKEHTYIYTPGRTPNITEIHLFP